LLHTLSEFPSKTTLNDVVLGQNRQTDFAI
jgi:hypothetical protein